MRLSAMNQGNFTTLVLTSVVEPSYMDKTFIFNRTECKRANHDQTAPFLGQN